MKRRSAVAALPALAFAIAARSQEAALPGPGASLPAPAGRSYLALSLIGDNCSVVSGGSDGGTGSMIGGRSTTKANPQTGAPLDGNALGALARAVQQAEPTATVGGLKSTDASHFSSQEDWFDGNRVKLPDALRKTIAGEHMQHLLLVTKHRGAARVSDGHMSEGPATGTFEGLGLYVNGHQVMQNGSRGFMAPFVFIRLSVIDLETFTVLRSENVESAHPMALNIGAGLGEISRMLSAAIEDTLPKMIAQSNSTT